MQRLRLLAVAVIAATLLALAGLAGPASPAGANPSFSPLAINTYTPRHSSNGCQYRVVYVQLGSIPVADLRLYGTSCTNVSVGVGRHNGTTINWTYNQANPTPYGVDSCGAYSLLQAVSATPGFSVGAIVIANNTSHPFRYDGTKPPPPVVPC